MGCQRSHSKVSTCVHTPPGIANSTAGHCIIVNGIVYSYDPTAVGTVTNNEFSIELIANISGENPPSGGFKSADEWEAELYVK